MLVFSNINGEIKCEKCEKFEKTILIFNSFLMVKFYLNSDFLEMIEDFKDKENADYYYISGKCDAYKEIQEKYNEIISENILD